MKISNVQVHVVRPIPGPPNVSGSSPGWVFVEINTDEGIRGVGECSNSPRKGNVLVGRALQTLREVLIGRDPSLIEQLWIELYRNYTYLGSRGLITSVISGVNIALWDIKGKTLGRPVYDLLGGPVREEISLYTHPAYGTPQEVAESGAAMVAEGYTALKTDPFASEARRYHTAYVGGAISHAGVRHAADIIATLRGAVGPEVEILIDAHGNFNVGSAMRCIRSLQPYDITWFEEPVPPESFDALRQIREQTDADLCVGERLYTRWDFLPVLQNRLANYIMPDVCWTGGISELKKIATMAEAYYVPVSPHNAMGPIQIVAGGHTMMTVPNFYRLEISSLMTPHYNACIEPGLDICGGALHLSERPGLGVELNQDWIEAHRDPEWD